MAEVIVPLDFASADEAFAMVDVLGDSGAFYKVGLELYTRAGPSVVRELADRGKKVFLDLKLHDIPNTVAGGVRAASELGVDLLTVHASGGSAMLDAARDAAGDRTKLLGVTVLTSLSASEIESAWGREIQSIRDEVVRLAELAATSRLDGVVASALEVSWLRRARPELLIVTPGIRPAGSDRGDQNRVATPAEAVRAGSDYLVIGRPITQADDPAAVLLAILDEITAATEE